MAETTTELPRAAPRKDDSAPSGWGLWVDDFDGAEADMCVQVAVHPRSGEPWPAEALLEKRVGNQDGTERWVAQNTGNGGTARWAKPCTERTRTEAGAEADKGEPEPCSVTAIDERPLAEIIHDFTSVPGWVPRRMEIEVLDGKYHIELAFEHESTLSGMADAPPSGGEPF